MKKCIQNLIPMISDFATARGGVGNGDESGADNGSNDRVWPILSRGRCVSYDDYFDSVFETHWLRNAPVTGWQLHLEIDGEATVSVKRRCSLGELTLATRDVSRLDGTAVIDIPPYAAGEWSRLFFTLVAKVDTRLRQAKWYAEVAAVRPVALSACFCTFNRENYLVRNLQTLLTDDTVLHVLRRIIVVNQGEPGPLRQRVDRLNLFDSGRLHLVNQENVGGSGGFARAMMEALADAGATHLVLMDDDIVIAPEMMFRTAAFLAICYADTTLGGQMLDLNRPHLMHEAGAMFCVRRLRVQALLRDADVRKRKTRDALSLDFSPDYNAWFYFAASLEHVRRIGLPLPLFINYDDVEYGFRLRQRAIARAIIPGIAIWHRPGYLSDNRWKTYYSIRNLLIINALYHIVPSSAITGMIVRRCVSWFRRGDLARVELSRRAIVDFLRGGAALVAEPGHLVAELRALCGGGGPRLSRRKVAQSFLRAMMRLQIYQRRADNCWRAEQPVLGSPEWWRGFLRGGADVPARAPQISSKETK